LIFEGRSYRIEHALMRPEVPSKTIAESEAHS
jgi:hypothetical protein